MTRNIPSSSSNGDFLSGRLSELCPAVSTGVDPWFGAVNERIQRLNNTGKGRAAVDLFLSLFGGEDVSAQSADENADDYSHDIELDDMCIEAKLACYSPSARNFHFSALRATRQFTHAWLVCVDFDCIKTFFVPKSAIKVVGKRQSQVTIPRYKTPRWLTGYEVRHEGGKWELPETLHGRLLVTPMGDAMLQPVKSRYDETCSGGNTVAEKTVSGANWLGQPSEPQAPDAQTRLNYVIPNRLEHLLTQYCAQTEMKPGPLVRRLITDFLKGEIVVNASDLDHPKGRRTSVDLPERLLGALEERCEELGLPTKAALIAALLGEFLPPRVNTDGIEKITVEVPTSIYGKIYERYGPGPNDEVIVDALCDLIQKNGSRAIPAKTEA